MTVVLGVSLARRRRRRKSQATHRCNLNTRTVSDQRLGSSRCQRQVFTRQATARHANVGVLAGEATIAGSHCHQLGPAFGVRVPVRPAIERGIRHQQIIVVTLPPIEIACADSKHCFELGHSVCKRPLEASGVIPCCLCRRKSAGPSRRHSTADSQRHRLPRCGSMTS